MTRLSYTLQPWMLPDPAGDRGGRVEGLPWGAGGLAWTRFVQETDETVHVTAGVTPSNASAGATVAWESGWVVGGGFEWDFAYNWTVKAEYLYMQFESFSYASPLTAAAVPFAPGYAWNTTVTPHEQVARVGVNYKFDWGPVVARY